MHICQPENFQPKHCFPHTRIKNEIRYTQMRNKESQIATFHFHFYRWRNWNSSCWALRLICFPNWVFIRRDTILSIIYLYAWYRVRRILYTTTHDAQIKMYTIQLVSCACNNVPVCLFVCFPSSVYFFATIMVSLKISEWKILSNYVEVPWFSYAIFERYTFCMMTITKENMRYSFSPLQCLRGCADHSCDKRI